MFLQILQEQMKLTYNNYYDRQVVVSPLQAYSSGGNGTSGTGVREMGICVVGTGGPCNGDSNWDSTHDKTGQCVLLNGCGNNNNKNVNNNVNGK
jgi:hypothetical protein